MLSTEDNTGERWKTTIGLISKKQLCSCSTLFCRFLYCCFLILKLLKTTGGNVVRVLVHFFSLLLISYSIWLVAASISHFVTAANKVSCCSFKKKMSPFLSLALDLCRPFSRWASLVCRLHVLSLFLCLSLALYSKFVDMTINLSLILSTTRIQKQFPLSVVVFIHSLVVSALQEAGGYAISRVTMHSSIIIFACFFHFQSLSVLSLGLALTIVEQSHVFHLLVAEKDLFLLQEQNSICNS